jgi:hypothetical protein
MARKNSSRKPITWSDPPRDSLEWLKLCFANAREAAERYEREDFERHSQRFGVEQAKRWRQESRRPDRMLQLLITLTLRLSEEEKAELAAWWNEPIE